MGSAIGVQLFQVREKESSSNRLSTGDEGPRGGLVRASSADTPAVAGVVKQKVVPYLDPILSFVSECKFYAH